VTQLLLYTAYVEKAAGEPETVGTERKRSAGRRQVDINLIDGQTMRAQRLGDSLPASNKQTNKQRFHSHAIQVREFLNAVLLVAKHEAKRI